MWILGLNGLKAQSHRPLTLEEQHLCNILLGTNLVVPKLIIIK